MEIREVQDKISKLREKEYELLKKTQSCKHILKKYKTETQMIPEYRWGTTGTETNVVEKVYFKHGNCSICGKEVLVRDTSRQFKKH